MSGPPTSRQSRSAPEVGQRWRYKPNRGSGTFTVICVRGERVTLRDFFGKDKSISLRTLRGDYEEAS